MNYKKDKEKILFLCTHNSARSQMAEGLINTLYRDSYEAFSAGTDPLWVYPYAIEVMEEIGIDISQAHAKSFDEFISKTFDYVVTVCDNAKEQCPVFPNTQSMIHKSFENPSSIQGNGEETLQAFRKTRDAMKIWLTKKFGEYDQK
jgi:arsenate reductase (thioredoxin)